MLKTITLENINLNSIDSVKEFVNITSSVSFDVDILSQDSHYCLDAKSIYGIFSLDLSKLVKVVVKYGSDSGIEEAVYAYLETIKSRFVTK